MSSIIWPERVILSLDMILSQTSVTIFRHPFSEDAKHSHDLLLSAAALYSGHSRSELGELEFNPWGKPYFPSFPNLHFSITHSGDWWLCGFSGAELGLDLQQHRSHVPPETLASRFFHPHENEFLAQKDYRNFYDLWTAKESWVKYTGHGFFDDPSTFSVVSAEHQFPVIDGAEFRPLPFSSGYSLCLCMKSIQDVHLLSL